MLVQQKILKITRWVKLLKKSVRGVIFILKKQYKMTLYTCIEL